MNETEQLLGSSDEPSYGTEEESTTNTWAGGLEYDSGSPSLSTLTMPLNAVLLPPLVDRSESLQSLSDSFSSLHQLHQKSTQSPQNEHQIKPESIQHNGSPVKRRRRPN